MSQVDKALKAFEYTTEWADLIAGEINTDLNLLFVFFKIDIQTETKKRHLAILFTAYIEVIFLNLRLKIQLTVMYLCYYF